MQVWCNIIYKKDGANAVNSVDVQVPKQDFTK